tara:strand:- start:763 stop:918 length:156 start_codon:yes stop_codon:yes gene_type:complete
VRDRESGSRRGGGKGGRGGLEILLQKKNEFITVLPGVVISKGYADCYKKRK